MEISHTVPPQNIMSVQQDILPLWRMSKKMVIYLNENQIIAQFQVRCMYFPKMEIYKTFQEKVEKLRALSFLGQL